MSPGAFLRRLAGLLRPQRPGPRPAPPGPAEWEEAVAQSPAPAVPPAPPAPAPRTPPPVPSQTWWWPPADLVTPPRPAPPRPATSCWEPPRRPAPLAVVVQVDWARLQAVVEGAEARELWGRLSFQRLTHQVSEPLGAYQPSREQRRWYFVRCDHGQAVGLATRGAEAVLLTSCGECASTFAAPPAPAAAPA
jgi:hypothetical protein